VFLSKGITASLPASPTPIILGLLKIPPLAYQLILKCGAFGGIKEKEPDIEICGILSLGKLHLKLKKPLILSITFLTVFFAVSIGLVIAVLILFQTEEAVDFILFQTLENVLFIPLTILDNVFQAVLIGLIIKFLIPFQVEEARDFILFQAVEQAVLMLFHWFFKSPAINLINPTTVSTTPDTIAAIALNAGKTTELITNCKAGSITLVINSIAGAKTVVSIPTTVDSTGTTADEISCAIAITAGARAAPITSCRSPNALLICLTAPWEVLAIVSFIPPKVELSLSEINCALSSALAVCSQAFSSSDN
jgi:hypothetical protein